jgi:anti-sigma factor RsiW
VTEMNCANPIDEGVLADYWLAALSPTEEESVEEHLLGCDACGNRLREIIAIADSIRTMARQGSVRVVVSEAFLERAAREGLRVRQYAPPRGGSVNCTVAADDDLLVGKLAVDLRQAARVDLCFTHPGGTIRLPDIPVNPESGSVVLSVAIDAMRLAPAHTAVIQLVAVDESGERVLGEYTFNHNPHHD